MIPAKFHDRISETLYRELPETSVAPLKALLDLGRFEVGQSYVTAKVQNRFGDKVSINIEGGRSGIELQETLFNLNGKNPKFAYLITTLSGSGETLVRKLPVIGVKDWLLIYDDELFLLAVKDAYDELDIRVVE